MSKEDFYSLTPSLVLDAIDSAGFRTTGELLQLNSYENRVFEVALEPNSSEFSKIVAKFYRPGRWSYETLLEEHDFIYDLMQNDIPVVAPLTQQNGSSLSLHNGMWMALFAKARGRRVQELSEKDFIRVGQSLARMHNIGEKKTFLRRPTLNTETYGWENLDLLDQWVAPEVVARYMTAAEDILYFLEDRMDPLKKIRIHCDVHKGNLLQVDLHDQANEFYFVDFDDCAMGTPAQDFWMLLPGQDEETQLELESLLEGYTQLRHFNRDELEIIPALRGLRIIHYAAWIARRWSDPSFPRLFPQYLDYNYWAAETDALEKVARGL